MMNIKVMNVNVPLQTGVPDGVVKYVEQERGTLVLSLWTEGPAMLVSTICMTRAQLAALVADHDSGALRRRLLALLRGPQDRHLARLDVKDLRVDVFLRKDQLDQAFRDLT